MVVGSGLLAQTFAHFKETETIIVFASGVSNSQEQDIVPFEREIKLLNEHLAEKYETRFGTEIISLRIAVVYGTGRKRGTTVWASDFVTLPALGKPITLPFPADDWHCCIYVEDVAEEIYQLMTKPRLGHRVFNSGGHTVQAADLASMVQQVIPEARISFSADRPRSPFIYQMDDSRIVRELGFQRRSMIEGIRNHVSYVSKFSHAGKL